MGIRKHFEEMKDKEVSKLSDFSYETEEKKDLRFDPEKEISNEEWEKMKDGLKKWGDHNKWGYFMQVAYMKTLFPDRFDQLGVDDTVLTEAFEYSLGIEYLHTAKFVQSLLTDKSKLFSLLPEKKTIDAMNSILESSWTGASETAWTMCAERMSQIRIVFPDKVDEMGLTDEVFDKLRKIWKEYYNSRQWSRCCDLTVNIRILFPKRFSELKFDDKFWQGIREGVNDNFKNVDRLAKMKILAADKVEVTDQGLEIEMPKKSLAEKKNPRPVRKKF